MQGRLAASEVVRSLLLGHVTATQLRPAISPLNGGGAALWGTVQALELRAAVHTTQPGHGDTAASAWPQLLLGPPVDQTPLLNAWAKPAL